MSIVCIVHLHATADALVPASLDGSLEGVGVIEVLHGLTAQVDAELLQLTRLTVLKHKHVEDPNEPLRGVVGVPHGLAEDGQALAGLLTSSSAHCAGMEAGDLVVD